MSEATRILSAIEQGDPSAAEELLPLVYNELRRLAAQKLAQEKPGQTLQATALVHEAYLRLVDASGAALEQPRPFLRRRGRGDAADPRRESPPQAAAQTGRRPWQQHVDSDDMPAIAARRPLEVLAVHEALDRLAAKSPRKAELVKLRYFLGLHDGRGGANPGHCPGDGRRRLDLRQGVAASAVAPGRGEKLARLRKKYRGFLPVLALDDEAHPETETSPCPKVKSSRRPSSCPRTSVRPTSTRPAAPTRNCAAKSNRCCGPTTPRSASFDDPARPAARP